MKICIACQVGEHDMCRRGKEDCGCELCEADEIEYRNVGFEGVP